MVTEFSNIFNGWWLCQVLFNDYHVRSLLHAACCTCMGCSQDQALWQLAALVWDAVRFKLSDSLPHLRGMQSGSSSLWLVQVCCFLHQDINILGFMPDKQLADFVGGRILLWLQGYMRRFSTLFFWGGGSIRGPVAVLFAAPIFPEGLLLGAQFLSPGSHLMCSLSSRVFQRNSSLPNLKSPVCHYICRIIHNLFYIFVAAS